MISLIRKWLFYRDYLRNRCHVDEEWCGIFIGRRYCSTHGYRWDPGEKPCPGHRQPTVNLPEGRWV